MSLRDVIARRISTGGPLSFAEYMDMALYHQELGYYARVDRRSGRTGDFFTSVDLGTLFGELLSDQFAEMWQFTSRADAGQDSTFAIVEAGAGSGRLARDVLNYSETALPEFYDAARFTLVERSPTGRRAHVTTLGKHTARLAGSQVDLPARVQGVIFANELLDAMPVHSIVMTDTGLREVYVDLDGDRFIEQLGVPSAAVRTHVGRFGIRLESGWRAEVSPKAVQWVEDAARRLERGFLMLIDYGHESTELYSLSHASGTLSCYRRHQVEVGINRKTMVPWLDEPGSRDITAHVDLTAVRHAAEQAGLYTLGVLDQTYFLLGLASEDTDVAERAERTDGIAAIKRRLALKTLLLPGGLGSTHKVLIFGKDIGMPRLRGCSFSQRAT